jgi:hypothetical protein
VGPHRVGAQAACVSTFGLACARTAPNAVATITGLDRSDGFAWDTYEEFAVPLDTVRANFARYGLLDEQVRFLAGWFRHPARRAVLATCGRAARRGPVRVHVGRDDLAVSETVARRLLDRRRLQIARACQGDPELFATCTGSRIA